MSLPGSRDSSIQGLSWGISRWWGGAQPCLQRQLSGLAEPLTPTGWKWGGWGQTPRDSASLMATQQGRQGRQRSPKPHPPPQTGTGHTAQQCPPQSLGPPILNPTVRKAGLKKLRKDAQTRHGLPGPPKPSPLATPSSQPLFPLKLNPII